MSPTIQALRGFSALVNATALVPASGKLAIRSVTSAFRKSQLASARTLFFTMFLACPLCVPLASAFFPQSKLATLAKSGLTFRPTDPLNEEAFDAFYNLD